MKLHPHIFEFLDAINEQNSRKYFATVRDLYDEIWENIQEIAAALIAELAKIDHEYEDLQPKDCLFRIYRDARRIKEGGPLYKDNFGIVLCPGGKKSSLPCFYFHIQSGKSFFGGGLYRPSSEELYNLRSYIRKHGDKYKKLTNDKHFKKFFDKVDGRNSIRVPKGFNSYDPYLETIIKKQHIIRSFISDKELLSVDIVKRCTERIFAAKGWMDFLTEGCETKAK